MRNSKKTRNKRKGRTSKRRSAGVTPHPLTALQMGYYQTSEGRADLAEAKASGMCPVHVTTSAEIEDLLRDLNVSVERLAAPDEEGGWSIDDEQRGMEGWRACRRHLRTHDASSEYFIFCEGLCNFYSVEGVSIVEFALTQIAVKRVGIKTIVEPAPEDEARFGMGGALCAAIDQDNFEWAAEILGAGGDVNAFDEDGRKPLHHACHDVEWVEKLLWFGAEVDAPDCNGVTPLTQAAYDGDRAVLEALIGAGAKVTGTALHQAAWLEDFERAKDNILCLVENGADPWARDEAGMTAAETARQVGNLALAAFIDGRWPAEMEAMA